MFFRQPRDFLLVGLLQLTYLLLIRLELRVVLLFNSILLVLQFFNLFVQLSGLEVQLLLVESLGALLLLQQVLVACPVLH